MARSPCHLLMKVNHVTVANFNVANIYFNAIRENKILAKISEFTVEPGNLGEVIITTGCNSKLWINTCT